jgi:hypothetical protein
MSQKEHEDLFAKKTMLLENVRKEKDQEKDQDQDGEGQENEDEEKSDNSDANSESTDPDAADEESESDPNSTDSDSTTDISAFTNPDVVQTSISLPESKTIKIAPPDSQTLTKMQAHNQDAWRYVRIEPVGDAR